MTKCDISFPLPLPDDPRKWQGWNNYRSPNYYERLCLDRYANPSNELIEEHCRELMRLWQKKLPLKNQPSNPLAQLLRSGLEESSRFLTEARVELVDPEHRRVLDEQLEALQHEAAIFEFLKYLEFVLSNGLLTVEEEKNLLRFGAERAPTEAEDLVDLYLEEADEKSLAAPPSATSTAPTPRAEGKPVSTPSPVEEKPSPAKIEHNPELERSRYSNFTNTVGEMMIFIPSADFTMGSDAEDAAPNERPLTHVTLSRFYISRCLITNAEYEQFDRAHQAKRAPGAGDRHPVVYLSYLDAVKFCQWLSTRERRKYRLPTEAEWEYAAKGNDQRKFPWGNYDGRGDLANFADRNTVFAWSDREIDDGYPESSPVGAFPLGASPFGIEDIAGNVWEWCLDYYELYRPGAKVNPRGPTTGTKRVHRGGSWKSRFSSLRTTVRSSNVPGFACNDLGFRIVCQCD